MIDLFQHFKNAALRRGFAGALDVFGAARIESDPSERRTLSVFGHDESVASLPQQRIRLVEMDESHLGAKRCSCETRHRLRHQRVRNLAKVAAGQLARIVKRSVDVGDVDTLQDRFERR